MKKEPREFRIEIDKNGHFMSLTASIVIDGVRHTSAFYPNETIWVREILKDIHPGQEPVEK